MTQSEKIIELIETALSNTSGSIRVGYNVEHNVAGLGLHNLTLILGEQNLKFSYLETPEIKDVCRQFDALMAQYKKDEDIWLQEQEDRKKEILKPRPWYIPVFVHSFLIKQLIYIENI